MKDYKELASWKRLVKDLSHEDFCHLNSFLWDYEQLEASH